MKISPIIIIVVVVVVVVENLFKFSPWSRRDVPPNKKTHNCVHYFFAK